MKISEFYSKNIVKESPKNLQFFLQKHPGWQDKADEDVTLKHLQSLQQLLPGSSFIRILQRLSAEQLCEIVMDSRQLKHIGSDNLPAFTSLLKLIDIAEKEARPRSFTVIKGLTHATNFTSKISSFLTSLSVAPVALPLLRTAEEIVFDNGPKIDARITVHQYCEKREVIKKFNIVQLDTMLYGTEDNTVRRNCAKVIWTRVQEETIFNDIFFNFFEKINNFQAVFIFLREIDNIDSLRRVDDIKDLNYGLQHIGLSIIYNNIRKKMEDFLTEANGKCQVFFQKLKEEKQPILVDVLIRVLSSSHYSKAARLQFFKASKDVLPKMITMTRLTRLAVLTDAKFLSYLLESIETIVMDSYDPLIELLRKYGIKKSENGAYLLLEKILFLSSLHDPVKIKSQKEGFLKIHLSKVVNIMYVLYWEDRTKLDCGFKLLEPVISASIDSYNQLISVDGVEKQKKIKVNNRFIIYLWDLCKNVKPNYNEEYRAFQQTIFDLFLEKLEQKTQEFRDPQSGKVILRGDNSTAIIMIITKLTGMQQKNAIEALAAKFSIVINTLPQLKELFLNTVEYKNIKNNFSLEFKIDEVKKLEELLRIFQLLNNQRNSNEHLLLSFILCYIGLLSPAIEYCMNQLAVKDHERLKGMFAEFPEVINMSLQSFIPLQIRKEENKDDASLKMRSNMEKIAQDIEETIRERSGNITIVDLLIRQVERSLGRPGVIFWSSPLRKTSMELKAFKKTDNMTNLSLEAQYHQLCSTVLASGDETLLIIFAILPKFFHLLEHCPGFEIKSARNTG